MSLFRRYEATGNRQQAVEKTSYATAYCLLPVAYLFLLSACGFQPVYSTGANLSDNSPIKAGIAISASSSGAVPSSANAMDSSVSTAVSRQFTNNLEDMIGDSANPAYRLDVTINQSVVGVGVARDGTASRYNLIINSSYKLTRNSDNKEVDSGNISSVTSYNNPNNQYFSTYISEQNARKNGITELAELYRQRLIAFVEKTRKSPPPQHENSSKSS